MNPLVSISPVLVLQYAQAIIGTSFLPTKLSPPAQQLTNFDTDYVKKKLWLYKILSILQLACVHIIFLLYRVKLSIHWMVQEGQFSNLLSWLHFLLPTLLPNPCVLHSFLVSLANVLALNNQPFPFGAWVHLNTPGSVELLCCLLPHPHSKQVARHKATAWGERDNF